ncbi:hypothetical protein CR513_05478, partial [Mucuna pruriens]
RRAKLGLCPQLRAVVWGVAAAVAAVYHCLSLPFCSSASFLPIQTFRTLVGSIESQLSQRRNSTRKIIELGQIQLSCDFWDKGFMTIWRNKRLKYHKKTKLHG